MKYRDAKILKEGNIISLNDGKVLKIISIETYGSVKTIRFNCKDELNVSCCVYNDEIKDIK